MSNTMKVSIEVDAITIEDAVRLAVREIIEDQVKTLVRENEALVLETILDNSVSVRDVARRELIKLFHLRAQERKWKALNKML